MKTFQSKKPIISVITPCYNLAPYLHRTIESIQSQTMSEWEIIIVDDCSTDDSFAIAESFAKQDPRITAIKLDKNSGSSHARNVALKHAKGQYITFIDGDDLVMPNKFKDQIQFMQDNNYAITYCNYRRMTPDETKTGILQRNPSKIHYDYLLRNTAMGTLTQIYDRDIIGEYFFDETLIARMDYAFWLDVLQAGNIAHRFDHDLARYRRGHTSLSSNINKGRKLVWKIYRQRQGLNYIHAWWCYINYAFHALKKRRSF